MIRDKQIIISSLGKEEKEKKNSAWIWHHQTTDFWLFLFTGWNASTCPGNEDLFNALDNELLPMQEMSDNRFYWNEN